MQARYIGRTNDYLRRKQEHEREGKLVGCDMYVLSYSYSLEIAKICEKAIIEAISKTQPVMNVQYNL